MFAQQISIAVGAAFRLVCVSVRIFVLILVLAAIVAIGCQHPITETGNTNNNPPVIADKDVENKLETNLRLWKEQGIADYDMTIRGGRGGMYIYADPAIVQVRNSIAISIVPASKDGPQMTTLFEKNDTVEKLFEAIRNANKEGAKVRSSYNKKMGYPEKVSMDFAHLPGKGVDSWITIEIKNIKAVNDDGKASPVSAEK